jgi:hypothetical protein
MTVGAALTPYLPQWRQIRQARGDLTDYVIHWTRGAVVNGKWLDVFEILKEIVRTGYLVPSFAPRASWTVGGANRTIQGPTPAVCFTEQPLGDFIDSCRVLPGRYSAYGVVLHKWHLYAYGGRPVMYGDEALLASLPDGYKYLWVRYNPIPAGDLGTFPVDWTHEREWRSVVREVTCGAFGKSPTEGVPLLLPPVKYPASESEVLAFRGS